MRAVSRLVPYWSAQAILFVALTSAALAAEVPASGAAAPPDAGPWYSQVSILGNEVWRIVALFLSLLVAYVAGRVSRAVLFDAAARLERRGWTYRAILLRTVARTAIVGLLALGLRVGLDFLVLPPGVRSMAGTINSVISTLVVAYAAYVMVELVDAWLMQLARRTTSKLDDMLVPMVRSSLRATVLVLVSVQVATILSDKPMTSVIAGLGVGGLAVGLAGQEMIKNFFGSLMIFSDRPFEMGNNIEVAGDTGTVEAVGFRSTRLRTGDGHLVTVPNSMLASAKVKNISAQPYLKRTLKLSLTYDNPPAKVREAVEIVRGLLANHDGMSPDRPPRVYFTDFQDAALTITATYWYSPPDTWKFQALGQWLNLEILSRFIDAGIRFAVPSPTALAPGEPPGAAATYRRSA